MEGIIDRIPHRSEENTQLLIQSEKVILSDRHLSSRGPSPSLSEGGKSALSYGGPPSIHLQALFPARIS